MGKSWKSWPVPTKIDSYWLVGVGKISLVLYVYILSLWFSWELGKKYYGRTFTAGGCTFVKTKIKFLHFNEIYSYLLNQYFWVHFFGENIWLESATSKFSPNLLNEYISILYLLQYSKLYTVESLFVAILELIN